MSRRIYRGASLAERVWIGFERMPSGCWEWRKAINPTGYGYVHFDGRMRYAHRLAYELIVGPIPEGLVLDHLCSNRCCVNPSHLEPVTQQENLMRGETLTAAHHAGRDCGFSSCRSCHRHRSQAVSS